MKPIEIKPLSTILSEIKPIERSSILGFVDSASYKSILAVAIELAKSLEDIREDKHKCVPGIIEIPENPAEAYLQGLNFTRDRLQKTILQVLTRAKEILEGK